MAASTSKLPKPIALSGTTTFSREVLGDEYVSALRDLSQRMQVYTRMRHGDGAVNTSLLAVEKPILGARWDVAEDKSTTEIAEAVKAELFDSDESDAHDPSLFELVLGQLVTYAQFGWAAVEPVWTLGADGLIHCRRPTLIRQQSARAFKLAPDNGLEALIQNTQGLDMAQHEIAVPASNLVLAVHRREGADYSGVSMLRPSYRAWMVRDQLIKIDLLHRDRFGAGTPTAVYPQGASDADKEAIEDALEAWRAANRSYIGVPFGTVLDIKGGDIKSDPTPLLAFFGAEIAKNTLSQLTELGTQGNTGNRALGGSFAELLRVGLQGMAEYLAKVMRRQLVAPFVRFNFGETAPVPQLTVKVSLAGAIELLQAITMATGAGLHLEPEDIAALRDELELPEIPLEELTKRLEQRRVQAIEDKRAAAGGTAPGAGKTGQGAPDGGDNAKPRTLADPPASGASARGLYISRPVVNAQRLARWFAVQPAFAGKTLAQDLHVTQLYSSTPVDVEPSYWTPAAKVTSAGLLGEDRAFVLFLDAPDLRERHGELLAAGATPTQRSYRPHVTLCYLAPGEAPPADLVLPPFDLVLGEERFTPLAATLSELELPPPEGSHGPELARDHRGRMRDARVVALEHTVMRPQLLGEELDRETGRATADLLDVLRDIDRELADQARTLAAQGADAVVAGAGDLAVSRKLAARLREATAAAAARAQAIGERAVLEELARQGLRDTTAGSGTRTLGERLRALLLADDGFWGGLAVFLRSVISLFVRREVEARAQAAAQAALEAVQEAARAADDLDVAHVGDRATGRVRRPVAPAPGAAARATAPATATSRVRSKAGAPPAPRTLDADAVAAHVADSLAQRSAKAVEARAAEVVNVAFGQGRKAAAQRYASLIEWQVRSEALDANTCAWCDAHDGDAYPMGDPRAPELPDVNCAGGYRCRGTYIYELAQGAA